MRTKLITLTCVLIIVIGVTAAFGNRAEARPNKYPTPQEVANLFLAAYAKYDFEQMREWSTTETGTYISTLEGLYAMATIDGSTIEGYDMGRATQCREEKGVAECDVCCDAAGNASTLTLLKKKDYWLVHII